MPKPKKERTVEAPPGVVYFKPQGVPMFQLEQVVLPLDEYEALRLADHEGLDQEQAAARLGVSRATCARILESAHRKVAEALTEGKAIRIEGGSFVLGRNRYRCLECHTVWQGEVQPEAGAAAAACPRCGSARVLDLARRAGWKPGGCRGPGRRLGGGFGPRGGRPPEA